MLRRRPFGPVELAVRTFGGDGTPVVFVHGSLDDHNGWREVLAALRPRVAAPLLTYDRRGHGASTDVPGQGTLAGDVDDLEAVVRAAGGVAHLVGHSYGATVVGELARRTPGLAASAFVLEPPLFGLLRERPALAATLDRARTAVQAAIQAIEAGELERGVQRFVDEVAFGEGAWRERLTDETRARFLAHADTWLDQARDRGRFQASPDGLARLGARATLCAGDKSLPAFAGVALVLVGTLPELTMVTIAGAAHDAPATHPDAVADALAEHLSRVPGGPQGEGVTVTSSS